MIARQRANLQRTFAHAEQPAVKSETARRLARTQRELAEATAEFTRGIEERAGPVPSLHEALEAMNAAAAALEAKDLRRATGDEETALAGLIKARQNLRKFLSDSNSSSASECRQFDNQQKQKIRRPEKKDDKERLAKLQQEIEQLAKEERKFSEDVSPPSSGGAQLDRQGEAPSKPSPSKGGSSGQGQKPSKADLSARQEQAARKARELQELMRKDESLTDLARERMDAAAGRIEESGRSLQDGRDGEASKQAAEAAEELERLARQVAGLKAGDLAGRMAAAENLAGRLARGQQGLAKELQGPGGKGNEARQAAGQRGQAEEAKTLADLLERLQEEAAEADAGLGRAVRDAGEAHPPAEAAGRMRRAGDALQAGKREEARRDAEGAGRSLDGLARQLDAARRQLVGPQLDRLLAAEKRAAEAEKSLNEVHGEGQKAEAERKLAELRDAVQSLQAGDGKVEEAADALAEALQSGAGRWINPGLLKESKEQGLHVPPKEYVTGVRRVITALQARIQELVLQDTLLEKDEAVPPQFKPLVEEYYRTLSEDVRP